MGKNLSPVTGENSFRLFTCSLVHPFTHSRFRMTPRSTHTPELPAYAELHCISNFTFLRGASHPEELAARAAQLGYSALAITDECSLAGVVRAHVAAKEHKLKLIIGAEFLVQDPPHASRLTPHAAKLVLLATDRDAYGNLSQLITTARRRSEKGSYHVTWADFERGVAGCLPILIPWALPASRLPSPATHLEHACRFRQCFPDRAWIATELLCGPDDRARVDQLRELSAASGLPLVAAGAG